MYCKYFREEILKNLYKFGALQNETIIKVLLIGSGNQLSLSLHVGFLFCFSERYLCLCIQRIIHNI
ncbi:MAG: hypothetical protein M3Q56_00630 [Bacteroidota bacterium]|nr:hypothetical protein [Bacteroidota bacterium]